MSKLEEKLALIRHHRTRPRSALLWLGPLRNYWRRRAVRGPAGNIILLEHDLLFRIEPGDSSSRRVWLKGNFSPELAWVVRKFAARGTVAVDVGANVGLVTLQLAHATGAEGRVVAFEPNARLIPRLKDAVALNGFGHVEIRAEACGSREGNVRFIVDARDHSLSKVSDAPGGAAEGEVVAMTTIDRALSQTDGRISLIKIDVEGYEAEVLGGARAVLAKHRPAIVFEVSAHDSAQIAAIQSHLEACRYRVLGVIREWGIEVKPLAPRMTEESHANVLAMPL